MIQAAKLQPEARVGQVIDDRYRIVQHLASGGMASVYRAEHLHNAGVVAIKVLHGALADNEEVSARFRREARAARSIRHPNVVSVWDVGRLPDGCSFMVLELIPGEDLCTALHRQKPFSQVRAVKIALQIAHALVSAHAAGVIHRDLKPDNIMLIERDGDPDFVKVVDFGIAKVFAQGVAIVSAVGSVFGTPEYMAPEQARGWPVDQRTDLYTLGTVLYEMLVGTTPFAHRNFAHVIRGQLSQPPPPLPAEIDGELADLVMKLLEKAPEGRFQTADELCEALRALLQRLAPGHPVLDSTRPSAPFQAGTRASAVHSVAPKCPPIAREAAGSGPTFAAEPVSSTIAVVRPIELASMPSLPNPQFEVELEIGAADDPRSEPGRPASTRDTSVQPALERAQGAELKPEMRRRNAWSTTAAGLGPVPALRNGAESGPSTHSAAKPVAPITGRKRSHNAAAVPPPRLKIAVLLGWAIVLAMLIAATYLVVQRV